jgi:hypothetical protein
MFLKKKKKKYKCHKFDTKTKGVKTLEKENLIKIKKKITKTLLKKKKFCLKKKSNEE